MSRGKLFALYVAAYTVGRGAIEALRIDHANHFLGLRLNDWTSLIVLLAAVTVLCWHGHLHPPLQAALRKSETCPPTTQRPLTAPATRNSNVGWARPRTFICTMRAAASVATVAAVAASAVHARGEAVVPACGGRSC